MPIRLRRLFIALPLLLLPLLAAAQEVEERWRVVDERNEVMVAGGRQARASIYRGDHMLALRCHDWKSQQWQTLVFTATWFVQPKARLTFTLTVDGGKPYEVAFQRQTNYRFVAEDVPQELLARLSSGVALKVSGPDFEGTPVSIPLKGSREAIEAAFALCGYAPLAQE